MAEQLYWACPECDATGQETEMEWDTGVYPPCTWCSGVGFLPADPVPVDSPDTAVPVEAIGRIVHDWGVYQWARKATDEDWVTVRAWLERQGVKP